MPSSWKKVPLKCLLPPLSPLWKPTKMCKKAAIPTIYFPRWIPIALAGLYSNTLGVRGVYERAVLLTWFLWAANGRSSSCTNMERIWLLLFVSAHSHCAACDRGQSGRGRRFASKPNLNASARWEKSQLGVVRLAEDPTFFCRRQML